MSLGTKNNPNGNSNDTIYLCNFRVSVDGEWLCLKELNDLGEVSNAFPPTPELERITYYPNYPVGPKGGDVEIREKLRLIINNQCSFAYSERDTVLIERSNL